MAKVRRFRGRFFGGSFCRLLFPVDGGVVAVVTVSGVAVRLLLLLAVASSLESTSTNTSSSSPSCSTDDGVSLYPRPLSPPLDVRPFCSDADSHHLVYPRFSAGVGDRTCAGFSVWVIIVGLVIKYGKVGVLGKFI